MYRNKNVVHINKKFVLQIKNALYRESDGVCTVNHEYDGSARSVVVTPEPTKLGLTTNIPHCKP